MVGAVAAAALLLGACAVGSDDDTSATAPAPMATMDHGVPVASHAPSRVADSGFAYDPPVPARSFTLTGMDGEPASLDDFRGQVVAIYFGYTFCPDMCPLTLGTYKAALARLPEEAAADLRVLLVSVDPARDTPEVLARYMPLFGEAFVGVTGTQDEVDAVLASWGLEVVREEPDESGRYAVAHPLESWVVDRDGRLRLKVSHYTGIDALVADLQSLIEEGR
jgi:protein SCO1